MQKEILEQRDILEQREILDPKEILEQREMLVNKVKEDSKRGFSTHHIVVTRFYINHTGLPLLKVLPHASIFCRNQLAISQLPSCLSLRSN